MDKNKLAEAVAALLSKTIDEGWFDRDVSLLSPLAFEFHKALIDKTEWCKILVDDGMKQYTYKPNAVTYLEGLGNTDEEAIFAAVLDWYSKRGDVND